MRLTVVLVCVAFGCGKGNGGAAGSASGSGAAQPADEAAAPVKTWKVGDVVQVRRDGNRWYEAEVVTAGPAYKVMYTFADQVEDNVDATRMRAEKWSKGSHVEAHVDGAWKRAAVTARHPDSSYDVTIDEGGATKTLAAADVRGERKPKSANVANTGGGGAPVRCTGNAFVRPCGGRCIDTSVDDNNCGRCGDRCNPGKHCDGHGFCREPNGDL